MHSNCGPLAPAPNAPWERPVQSPFYQTLTGNGNIELGTRLTMWQQTNPQGDGKPYVIALPNGNFIGQTQTVLINSESVASTASFYVSGVFTNCVSYLYNTTATFGLFLWDGAAWQLLGGNAQPSQVAPTT